MAALHFSPLNYLFALNHSTKCKKIKIIKYIKWIYFKITEFRDYKIFILVFSLNGIHYLLLPYFN